MLFRNFAQIFYTIRMAFRKCYIKAGGNCRRMGISLLLVLAGSLFCMGRNAEEPQGLPLRAEVSFNGTRCVADVDAGVLYCPVKAEPGRPVEVSFSVSAPSMTICFDGQPLPQGGNVTVGNWQEDHTLTVDRDGLADSWRVVFTTLPVVELSSTGNLSAEYSPGTIRIVDPLARTDGQVDITFSCQQRYRGASSMFNEKKSFAVKLFDAAGEDLDAPVLGIREENSWILDAAVRDVSRMRNRVLFDLWNEMSCLPYGSQSRNGTKGDYVEFVLDGRYHGLYCLSDKIDRKLLDLKKSTADRMRGLLYKCASWGTAVYLSSYDEAPMDVASWNGWELKHPEDFPSETTWQPLADLIDFCADSTRFDREWLAEVPTRFYEDNLRQYIIFAIAFCLRDNLFYNTYLSCRNYEVDRRLLITPWDLDFTLGRHGNGNKLDYILTPKDFLESTALYRRLLFETDGSFIEDVARELYELYGTTLSPQHLEEAFQAYAARLVSSGAWRRERERWGGNPVELPEDPQEEIDFMMSWYVRNCAQVRTLIPVPTGIGPLRAVPAKQDIYSLDGRRLPVPPSRGFYIEGGRKRMR